MDLKNKMEINATLYTTKNMPITDVSLEYIKSITYNFAKPTDMVLEIPKHITRNGNKVINNLYNQVKPRMSIVVEIDGVPERFIISEHTSTKLEKSKGIKSFKCHSFEQTLKNRRIDFDQKVRMIKSDDTFIADGYLDIIIKDLKDWTLGEVDKQVMFITQMANETKIINLFENYTNNKVTEEGLIWEKSVTTDVEDKYCVKIKIDYLGMKTYASDGKLLKTEQLENEFTGFHANVKKISAYHYSGTNNRFGIKYVITLADDSTKEVIHTFTNVINKKVVFENINLSYETGKIIEGTVPKMIQMDAVNTNILDLLTTLQGLFDCVFFYDTINKVISCKHKDNVGEDLPQELSFDTNTISVEIKPNNELLSCLAVEGNVSIASENKYGTDFLWNYKYYQENIFEQELSDKLDKYNEVLDTKQAEYEAIRLVINEKVSAKTKADSKIDSLAYRIKYLTNLLTAYVAGNEPDRQKEVKLQIEGLETQLNAEIASRVEIQNQLLGLEDDLIKIAKSITRENVVDESGAKIFDAEDLEILEESTYCSIYEDSYYTTEYALYRNALLVFEDKLKPKVDISCDVKDISKITRNKLNDIFKLGSYFFVDTEEMKEIGEDKVRFVGYQLEPKSQKFSNLKFTNKEFASEKMNITSNVGKKVVSTSNTTKTFADVWNDAQGSVNFAEEIRTNGLDLVATQIRSRTDSNLIDMSEAGIFVSNADEQEKQVYIGSSVISLTTDSWKTSKTAITPEGIMADTIIGKLLIGEELIISSDEGQFTIGLNEDKTRMGIHVKDEALRDRIFLGLEKQGDIQVAKLELRSADDSRRVVLDDRGIVSEYQLVDRSSVDSGTAMYSYLRLQDNVNEVIESIISIKLRPFRTYQKGMKNNDTYASTVSSLSGGGNTSSNSGGWSKSYGSTSSTDITGDISVYTGLDQSPGTPDTEGRHYHRTTINSRSHSHDVSISVTSPNHQHQIYDHKHEINLSIPGHQHEMNLGCFDETGSENMPSNVKLYVNGTLVRSNINTDAEISIAQYLQKGTLNEIKLESDTRGVIHFNLYAKSFILW